MNYQSMKAPLQQGELSEHEGLKVPLEQGELSEHGGRYVNFFVSFLRISAGKKHCRIQLAANQMCFSRINKQAHFKQNVND